MKLVQKILSHGLLIAFILAAFLVYTKRGDLFPQWVGKTEKTQQQTATDVTTAGVIETVDEPDSEPVREEPQSTQPEYVTEAKPEPEHEPEEVKQEIEPDQETSLLTTEDMTPVETETETEIEAVPVPPIEEDLQPAESAGTTKQQVSADPVNPPVPGTGVKLQEQLNQARQHFWQRNMPAAEKIYQAIAESNPQNPDVWGEIGNFYYALQKREPVIEAYTRSAELFIEQGEPMHVRQLIGVLYRLGAPQARKLEMRMQQTGG